MTTMHEWLRPVGDGSLRCWWAGDDEQYQRYHDTEWGRPVLDDRRLFEKLCLEGFQSGLSWLTILRKRENFRRAFGNFEIDAVARFGTSDVERLLGDAGIVRHRGKIEAVINNAGCAADMIASGETLSGLVWGFASTNPFGRDGTSQHSSGIPTTSPSAIALSKNLKKRGWKFVGPTTVYSFMQSMGLVNDHIEGCRARDECERERLKVHGSP
jgi:DNA-3-methyladenine glycosylase I